MLSTTANHSLPDEDGDWFLPHGAPPSFQPFGLGLCIWSRIGLTGVNSSFEIILL